MAKAQETLYAELLALSAVVYATTSQRNAANAIALAKGRGSELPYDDDVPWPELDALHAELRARGLLDD